MIFKWINVKNKDSKIRYPYYDIHDTDDIQIIPFLGLLLHSAVVKIQTAFNVSEGYALTVTRHFLLSSNKYAVFIYFIYIFFVKVS